MIDDCEQCGQHPEPTRPVVPLNDPGQPLRLWHGDFLAPTTDEPRSTAPGVVELTWKRRTHLTWQADVSALDPNAQRQWYSRRDQRVLGLDFHGTSSSLTTYFLRDFAGWTNGGLVGDAARPVPSVVAHWTCLPTFGGTMIHEHAPEGGWSTWNGRAGFTFAGWDITLDARRGHKEIYQQAVEDEQIAVTHVMDLRRSDGAEFAAPAALEVMEGLQMAFSFALGYWVSPIAPTGLDDTGTPVWARWRTSHTQPPRRGLGWWNDGRVVPDLAHLFEVFMKHWLDPAKQDGLNVPVALAVQSVEVGYTEQRIMAAISAIEMLAFISEVREGGVSEEDWNNNRQAAWKRTAKLLDAAQIDRALDNTRTPGLRAYAKGNNYDGAWAIVDIRNRIAHPKDNNDLYADPRLLIEACRLSLRYLELLLLHRIGYVGHTEDRTRLEGWIGESDLVPWA
jgi:hypothetical protein